MSDDFDDFDGFTIDEAAAESPPQSTAMAATLVLKSRH